jgi:hypothetical protein
MAAILALILLYVVVQVLLLAVSVGIGFILQWFIPDLGIGTGILIGLVSTVASAHCLVQLIRFASAHAMEEIEPTDLDDDEDEAMPVLHVALPPLMKRRRRHSKRR